MSKTSTTKHLVIAFNLTCALIALVLIAFGIYVLLTYDTNDIGSIAAYAYIGVGVAALLIFLIGSFGALRESVCCTVTFIILLYVVIIAQSVVVFVLTHNNESVASNLTNSLDTTWEEELKSPGAMSIYEDWFSCCGRASPHDYVVHDRLPPASCFKDNDKKQADNLITVGCRIAFENYWINLLQIFNILAWVMIGLEFIGSILSCCLCNSIRNDHRRAYF